MKSSQAAFAAATFAFFSVVAPVAWAQGRSEHIMVAPKDLTWADVPSLPPGAKIAVIEGPMNEAKPFTVRLKFPANYKIPAHSHPAIEHVTVITGTFNMGTGDKLDPKQTKAMSAGSVAIVTSSGDSDRRRSCSRWARPEMMLSCKSGRIRGPIRTAASSARARRAAGPVSLFPTAAARSLAQA